MGELLGFRQVAVISVEEQISEIGTVDKQSLDLIEDAESAFSALSEKERTKVGNYDVLVSAREAYDKALADEVVVLIDKIGNVTESSINAIEDAKEAYAKLTDAQKGKVGNYDKLELAADEYDTIIADEVVALIEKIGTVTEKSIDVIEEAEGAYAKLTDSQKNKVDNYSDLGTAKEQYDALLVSNVEKMIAAVQYSGEEEPTDALKQSIDNAKKEYGKLDDSLKARVGNYAQLEKVSEEISKYYVQKTQEAINNAIATDAGYDVAEKLYTALTAEEAKQITDYNAFTEKYEAYKNRPPIELVSYKLGKNSIGRPELYLKAKNITDKIIKEFSIDVYAYDADGIPVSVHFGDYTHGYRYSNAVKAGEYTKSNSYWTLYGEYNSMKQLVIIVDDVEFFDGTTWENPQSSTLRARYEQKLLVEGDSNIVPRS